MAYWTKYLRTNYKVTGKEIDADAIGGGVAQGSWGGGSGIKQWFGGFIMGSFASQIVVSTTGHPVSAAGAIASYYGSAPGWSDITGYRIAPFMIKDASHDFSGGNISELYQFRASIGAAGDSNFYVVGHRLTRFTQGQATWVAPSVSSYQFQSFASAESTHFVWAGWIISGP